MNGAGRWGAADGGANFWGWGDGDCGWGVAGVDLFLVFVECTEGVFCFEVVVCLGVLVECCGTGD